MKSIIALDQGTTSSRAIAFDEQTRILAQAQQEFKQHFPRAGWVEHDPGDIWESQKSVLEDVLTKIDDETDVTALGITNQRETTLIWDRETGEPLHRAIVWQDRRTAPICKELKQAGHEDAFKEKTGLVLDPYFSGTKIKWLLDNVDGLREKADAGDCCFGTMDTWLIWNLTGGEVHATDVSNASRTLLWNLDSQKWDEKLLEILGIPPSLLPEVKDSSGSFGEVTRIDGLNGIPIAGVAGDQQAALFGQACYEPGMAKNTYGTGCFLLMQTGDRLVASEHGLLTTAAWRIDGAMEYALEGSVFMAGATVQWLRDGLEMISSSSDIEALAREVDSSDGVILVPAFTGLGAPYWDPDARGAILGMTRGTNKAHIARAALDSIAFQSAEVLHAMEQDAGARLKEVRVDGGACVNDLLMQFQADLVQTEVIRPEVTETTALGAALLAGLATGIWESKSQIAEMWRQEKAFSPACSAEERDERMAEWKAAVNRVL